MKCEVSGHKDKIEYVCQSPNCDYMPLCKQCKKKHNPQHFNYMIRYQIAVQKGRKNIQSQIKKLEEYMAPIKKRGQIKQAILRQIKQLKQQKQRLIQIIRKQIDNQIQELIRKNKVNQIQQEQKKFYDQLESKMKRLQQMENNLQSQSKTLRISLSTEIQQYLFYISKKYPHSPLTHHSKKQDINIAHLYTSIEHHLQLSKLQLHKQIINPKLLKTVNNDSPLYFLIDNQYSTGNYLHYFIPENKQGIQLRLYDVQRQKWSKHISRDIQSPKTDFSTLYDYYNNQFYLICGKNKYSGPTNQIIQYDKTNNKWKTFYINTARYGAMSALVTIQNKNYILIAGGFDSKNRALKNCQIFDTDEEEIINNQGQMNFACGYGRLVVFDRNIVFKIGGFSNKSQRQRGICPIVQKLDFSTIKVSLRGPYNFSYIEVQDICKQNVNQSLIKKYQLYYGYQGGIQINANQILIYGGRMSNDKQIDQTYILNFQRFKMTNYEGNQITSYRYYARWINEKKLISPMSFYSFNPIIWKGKLYSLQHLPSLQDQVYKGLIEFDMRSWYQTQNIVDDKV